MTLEQAHTVKALLLEIRDTLPADKVDTIFNWYREFINPNHVKPCTCNPRYWNEMITRLRDEVETTLNSYEATNIPSESAG